MPNTSEVNVHTYFFKKVRIEGSGMTKASILDHGVGLTLAVILQVEVWCIIFIYLHVLGLQFCSLLLELFFLFVLLIIHCSRCWCRFGGMMRARLTLRTGRAQPRHPLESSGNFPPCTSHACNKNEREQLDLGYVSKMKMKLLPKNCSSKYVINLAAKK